MRLAREKQEVCAVGHSSGFPCARNVQRCSLTSGGSVNIVSSTPYEQRRKGVRPRLAPSKIASPALVAYQNSLFLAFRAPIVFNKARRTSGTRQERIHSYQAAFGELLKIEMRLTADGKNLGTGTWPRVAFGSSSATKSRYNLSTSCREESQLSIPRGWMSRESTSPPSLCAKDSC